MKRRGMALMAVMIIVLLAASTILAMGTLFATQAKRTRDLPQTAQHEQLLLAGTQALLARLETGRPVDAFAVDLPQELPGLKLSCAREGGVKGQESWYEIRVMDLQGKTAARQRVRLEQRENRWRVAEAALGGL